MNVIVKSWMVLFSLFIVLSSVRIQRITQHYGFNKDTPLDQRVFNFEASLSGAHAMAMQLSMQMPMGMPPPPMPFHLPIPVRVPVLDLGMQPNKVFINSLPGGGPFGPAIPLPLPQQQRPNQPTNQNVPQNCHCGQNQQPSNQYGNQMCHCQPSYQQPPQYQQNCPPCSNRPQYPPQAQPHPPQLPCCNQMKPPVQQPPPQHSYCPPCPHQPQYPQYPQPNNPQCMICNQRPNQPPGPGMMPVAQVVLTPQGKCDDSDTDDSDSDSDDSDDCARRCKKKVARMNDERRNLYRSSRRSNVHKQKKYSSSRSHEFKESHEIGIHKTEALHPVLTYVAKNGDVRYKTKISKDDALDLIDFEHLKRDNLYARRAFSGTKSSPVIRVARGHPLKIKTKVQEDMIPGKPLVFQSPSGNEITNLSLTFLFE